MILHDLFDWTNSGVGVAGLALTVGAIWQATGAKKAAREARGAVYRRNAADAMVEIVRIAEQLNTSVLYERGTEASIQLRELAVRIPRDREEFAKFLASDAGKLTDVESTCNRWADFFAQGEFPLNAAQKRDLFIETLKTVQELSAIQGRLRRMLDQEEL
jgi:ribosomal protein L31E